MSPGSEVTPFDFGDGECPNKDKNEWWDKVPAAIRSGMLTTLDDYDHFCPNCQTDSVLIISGGARMGTIPVGQIIQITYYCPTCQTPFLHGRAVKDRGDAVRLIDVRKRQVQDAPGQTIKPRVRKEK